MASAPRLAVRWATALTTDARSIAASRIALGALVLVDCAQRASLLDAFYTDAGYVPRAEARLVWSLLFPPSPPPWSLHTWGGSLGWQIVLLALEVTAALALAVGYRARLASIASFVLFLSHCQRNALVCDGQDWALVAFLMWSMFVPLDGAWALRQSARPARRFDVGSFAFAAQLVMLLFFAGVQKVMNSGAWRSGEALSIVLGLDFGITPLGRWLGGLPAPLLGAITYGVLFSELVLPWLLLLPVGRAVRGAAIVLIALQMLAFWACLKIGLFPWVVLAALLFRVPGAFWDSLGLVSHGPASGTLTRSPTSKLAPIVAALVLVHALLLNLCRLSGEFRGPAWLDAASGFLVPRQGWRMYSTVEPSTLSTWIVLSAQAASTSGTAIRLPDAAALSYGPESSTDALFGSLRQRLFWSHAPALRSGVPQILDRVAERQCADLPIRRFGIVLVERDRSAVTRSVIGDYPCGLHHQATKTLQHPAYAAHRKVVPEEVHRNAGVE